MLTIARPAKPSFASLAGNPTDFSGFLCVDLANLVEQNLMFLVLGKVGFEPTKK